MGLRAPASRRGTGRHSELERTALHRKAGELKRRLRTAGLPLMPSPSHIVPVLIGNARCANAVTDSLMERHGIYVQPINYPTVPKGSERLRLTPGPFHSEAQMDQLVGALVELFEAHAVGAAA